MSFKGALSVVFVCLFALGSAKYCTFNSNCTSWQTCCSNNVCGAACPISSCSYDFQCSAGKKCCGNGECSSACTHWSGASIAGAVISIGVFFAIIISIVICRNCSGCPYYRYRTPAAVIVARQLGYQPLVSTVSTTQSSQQNMQQFPPPGNYQPPPGYNQPPPAYPSYPQYPAPQEQAQVSMPPPVSAGQPVGKN